MDRLRGTYTALVTPMDKGGRLDLDGFKRLVTLQLDAGVDGLVPLGSTGEASTLELDEEVELIKACILLSREHAKKTGKTPAPVIVGTGSNSTKSAVEYTQRAKDLGADAALVVCPYYNKPTNEGIYLHYKAVAEVGLPVLVYNIAGRTARNIETAVLERIANLPGIIGVKEGSGDINQITDVIDRIGRERPDFTVLAGDDALTFPLIALGADGIVSVASNLVPERVCAMVRSALAGDVENARLAHYSLLPLFRGAFIETNPICIKQAMDWVGLPGGPTRMPLCGMEETNKQKLRSALELAGIKLKG